MIAATPITPPNEPILPAPLATTVDAGAAVVLDPGTTDVIGLGLGLAVVLRMTVVPAVAVGRAYVVVLCI